MSISPPPPYDVVTLDVGYPVKNVNGVGRKKQKSIFWTVIIE